MGQIVLDFGSGNTCQNDKRIVKHMIDALKAVDTGKHEIIIKWQLFKEAGQNIPLRHDVFDYAYYYAVTKEYKTTSSVFDRESLDFLLQYPIPFVKIANRRDLDWLISWVPRRIPVYVSGDNANIVPFEDTGDEYTKSIKYMACISKYPAGIQDYENTNWNLKTVGVSDHTVGLNLFKKYQPGIWEKHYKLLGSTGLDAGEFAITPEELREIL
jgi:sialic acid synthase SpsE